MQRSLLRMLVCVAATAGALSIASAGEEDTSYTKEIEAWRAERQANLEKDDGWLTVAGLYWLREGENWVGTDLASDFVLPEGSAPAVVGVFSVEGDETRFRPSEGVAVTRQGKPVTDVVLEPGEKNAVTLGRLSMWVHLSGPRKAIRLRDVESPIRKQFTGLDWFPVEPGYRVTARFTPHAEPRPVEILNLLGDIEKYESPGYVDFVIQGEPVRMEPVWNSQKGLWLIFRDGTSGKETYPAARFLHTDAPENGQVVIDFNKAYNPPCAFNPYTTCPMPPKENRLKIRVEAGEKYKGHS